jgi:hypothetical protein
VSGCMKGKRAPPPPPPLPPSLSSSRVTKVLRGARLSWVGPPLGDVRPVSSVGDFSGIIPHSYFGRQIAWPTDCSLADRLTDRLQTYGVLTPTRPNNRYVCLMMVCWCGLEREGRSVMPCPPHQSAQKGSAGRPYRFAPNPQPKP